jgi:hypothetical protein
LPGLHVNRRPGRNDRGAAVVDLRRTQLRT